MSIYIGTGKTKSIYVGTNKVKAIYLGTNKVWSQKSGEFTGLCFTAEQANSTIGLQMVGSPSFSGTQYSFDGQTWTNYSVNTTATMITLANVGDKVYFRNTVKAAFSTSKYLMFVMTGKIAASGNCNSMVSAEGYETLSTQPYNYALCYLFHNCTSLTSAPELPSTTLKTGSYARMFYGCTSLEIPPELPATTAVGSCYTYMFRGCTSLKYVPELPSTSLPNTCYSYMFYGCTSLYVSDTQTASAQYRWAIPKGGAVTSKGTSSPGASMFTNCLGTRSSNNMTGDVGTQYVYYTQNPPISAS